MAKTKETNAVDKYVGQRVRMGRLMLHMSQSDLGDKLGVTFQQVQKYEKGRNRVGASRLQQISAALQLPVAWFFEGGPGQRSNGNGEDLIAQFAQDRAAIDLAEAFMKIKPVIRSRIASLTRALADQEEER